MSLSDADFFELIQQKDVAGVMAALAERTELAGARDTYLGSTPLHVAAATNQADAVRQLLDLGADPWARTSTGLTPLAAARQRRHEATAALLSKAAPPDVQIRHLAGEQPAMLTPLQFAARAGCADVARVLLAAGADPNAGRSAGVPTPLHFAAGERHLDTVRLLLGSGADRSARDRAYHATPAGWAEFAEHAEIVALLSE